MNRKSVLDLKAFVPAKDFTLAKQFYVDLGFSLLWGSEELAAFQVGEFRFCCRTTTWSNGRRTS